MTCVVAYQNILVYTPDFLFWIQCHNKKYTTNNFLPLYFNSLPSMTVCGSLLLVTIYAFSPPLFLFCNTVPPCPRAFGKDLNKNGRFLRIFDFIFLLPNTWCGKKKNSLRCIGILHCKYKWNLLKFKTGSGHFCILNLQLWRKWRKNRKRRGRQRNTKIALKTVGHFKYTHLSKQYFKFKYAISAFKLHLEIT